MLARAFGILCLLALAVSSYAAVDDDYNELFDAAELIDEEDEVDACLSVSSSCLISNTCGGERDIVVMCDNYEGKGKYRLTYRFSASAKYQIPGCNACEQESVSEAVPQNSSPVPGPHSNEDAPEIDHASASGLPPNSQGCSAMHGMCWDTTKATCSGSLVSGLCSGSSAIKCCVPPSAEQSKACVDVQGTCINSNTSPCVGTIKTGLCNGPSEYKCCVKGSATPPPPPPVSGPRARPASRITCASGPGMGKLVPIPTDLIPNQLGLTYAKHSMMLKSLGEPCKLQEDCASITNPTLSKKLKSGKVGHIKVYGMAPAVESLERIFTRIQRDLPEVWASLASSGMVCCRAVRGSTTSYSNHSWGMAIDFNVNGVLDPRSDAKTQCALLAIWPYFNEEGWFWAAGYQGKSEDAMHFEVAEQTVQKWIAEGKL